MSRKSRVHSTDSSSLPCDGSGDALSEIDQFFKRSHKVIVPLTVDDILNEQLARKLA